MALVDIIGTLFASAGTASYGDGMLRSMAIGSMCNTPLKMVLYSAFEDLGDFEDLL